MKQEYMFIKVRNLFLVLGIALDNLKEFNKAINMYDLAIQLNQNSAEAYYNKGNKLILN